LSPWQLKQAVRCVRNGGIIAYPTEAVYGLGCNPLDAIAVHQLLQIKNRSWEKGLILVAYDMSQLEPFIEPPDTDILNRLQSTWPGPVTWLLKSRPDVPSWLTGKHETIAVRISNHIIVRSLCKQLGHALISTSANPSKSPPAKTSLKVQRYFHQQVDFIICGNLGGENRPCEIRDGQSDTIIRSN
jgi:L-threonylcarbamoyladenylate synthase